MCKLPNPSENFNKIIMKIGLGVETGWRKGGMS